MKKQIHVKEYTRKRHGRAKFGGKVRAHDKSGRAKPPYTPEELNSVVKEMRIEVQGDPSVGWWGADIDTIEKDWVNNIDASDHKERRRFTRLIEDAANVLRQEEHEALKREDELYNEWREEEFEKEKEQLFKPMSKAVRHHGIFSGRASHKVEEALKRFEQDYRKRWGVSPSQKERVWKRIELEKQERDSEIQLALGQIPPKKERKTPGKHYSENIYPGNVPKIKGRRSRTSTSKDPSYYKRRIRRGD